MKRTAQKKRYAYHRTRSKPFPECKGLTLIETVIALSILIGVVHLITVFYMKRLQTHHEHMRYQYAFIALSSADELSKSAHGSECWKRWNLHILKNIPNAHIMNTAQGLDVCWESCFFNEA